MAPWLQFLEAWMVQQLLRMPGFHRLAERAARNVHRVRNGLPKDSGDGGTSLDGQQNSEFLKHFMDELKTQLGQAENQQGSSTAVKTTTQTNSRQPRPPPKEPEGAHEVWESQKPGIQNGDGGRQKQRGFMGEYVDALREQLNSGKSKRMRKVLALDSHSTRLSLRGVSHLDDDDHQLNFAIMDLRGWPEA